MNIISMDTMKPYKSTIFMFIKAMLYGLARAKAEQAKVIHGPSSNLGATVIYGGNLRFSPMTGHIV